MIDINTFLFNLLSVTNFKFIPQLSKIVRDILCTLQGGITQKNISRQTSDDGYSLRSVQRFFALSIDWSSLYQPIIQHFLKDEEVLLASVDEVVQKEAGKSTNGLGFFFQLLSQQGDTKCMLPCHFCHSFGFKKKVSINIYVKNICYFYI